MSDGGKSLYLDLLIKVLANTIYGDPSIRQDDDGTYEPGRRLIGSDWPAVAHTMVGIARLENLRDLTQRTLDENIPGDYIETGVWRGGCCILMRGVLAANQVSDRKIYLADSFAGMPPVNATEYPEDEGWNLDKFPQLAVPLDQVRDNFSRYGLLDDQLVFVKGWFSETLPALPANSFAMIRLDGDLYESTHVALECLYPKLSPGGYVIIDDYRLEPCRAAVDAYRAREGISAPLQKIDWTAVWWRKDPPTSDPR